MSEKIVIKKGVSETMRKYLWFLRYHHKYTRERLLEAFPEYLEKVKSKLNSQEEV